MRDYYIVFSMRFSNPANALSCWAANDECAVALIGMTSWLDIAWHMEVKVNLNAV